MAKLITPDALPAAIGAAETRLSDARVSFETRLRVINAEIATLCDQRKAHANDQPITQPIADVYVRLAELNESRQLLKAHREAQEPEILAELAALRRLEGLHSQGRDIRRIQIAEQYIRITGEPDRFDDRDRGCLETAMLFGLWLAQGMPAPAPEFFGTGASGYRLYELQWVGPATLTPDEVDACIYWAEQLMCRRLDLKSSAIVRAPGQCDPFGEDED